jgi:hypothetical protein
MGSGIEAMVFGTIALKLHFPLVRLTSDCIQVTISSALLPFSPCFQASWLNTSRLRRAASHRLLPPKTHLSHRLFEQLVLLRPMDRLLVMRMLKHEREVTKPQAFEDQAPEVQVSTEEFKLTSFPLRGSSTSQSTGTYTGRSSPS